MAEKKRFGEKAEAFFAGKGFYIVLFLCVAVIGLSAYYLLTGNGNDVETENTVIRDGGYEAAAPYDEDPELAVPPELEENPVMGETDGGAVVSSETEAAAETPGAGTAEQAGAASVQYIWPLDGEIDIPYAVTALIYNKKLGDWRTHDGVDIAAPLGTQVLAVCSGQVERIYTDDMGGMTVVIAHTGGVRSVYSNLAEVPTVYEGDNVMIGEVIGAVGVTAPGETKENPHLCFSMTLDGQSVNPSDNLPPR